MRHRAPLPKAGSGASRAKRNLVQRRLRGLRKVCEKKADIVAERAIPRAGNDHAPASDLPRSARRDQIDAQLSPVGNRVQAMKLDPIAADLKRVGREGEVGVQVRFWRAKKPGSIDSAGAHSFMGSTYHALFERQTI